MKEWRRAFNQWLESDIRRDVETAFRAGFHAGVLSQTEATGEALRATEDAVKPKSDICSGGCVLADGDWILDACAFMRHRR